MQTVGLTHKQFPMTEVMTERSGERAVGHQVRAPGAMELVLTLSALTHLCLLQKLGQIKFRHIPNAHIVETLKVMTTGIGDASIVGTKSPNHFIYHNIS